MSLPPKPYNVLMRDSWTKVPVHQSSSCTRGMSIGRGIAMQPLIQCQGGSPVDAQKKIAAELWDTVEEWDA